MLVRKFVQILGVIGFIASVRIGIMREMEKSGAVDATITNLRVTKLRYRSEFCSFTDTSKPH